MRNERGFTLIELLLVVMVIGFMLAIIVPRGMRANTDAKYNLVRQNASELASHANEWIEQQIIAQDENSTATRAAYLTTLVETAALGAQWVATDDANNWNKQTGLVNIVGRRMDGAGPVAPENSVEEIIEPAKIPRNPFNGGSIFLAGPNDPENSASVIPGALACAYSDDDSTTGSFNYYAFVFQGTDSTAGGIATTADYHAGQGVGITNLAGVREGVFFTKVRQ